MKNNGRGWLLVLFLACGVVVFWKPILIAIMVLGLAAMFYGVGSLLSVVQR
jgi:hypothetical protein